MGPLEVCCATNIMAGADVPDASATPDAPTVCGTRCNGARVARSSPVVVGGRGWSWVVWVDVGGRGWAWLVVVGRGWGVGRRGWSWVGRGWAWAVMGGAQVVVGGRGWAWVERRRSRVVVGGLPFRTFRVQNSMKEVEWR